MIRAHALRRTGHGWQLIFADLALILFLLTLSALPAAEAESRQKLADSDARSEDARRPAATEIAAAQALFRPVNGGPSLREWLASQPHDPRATLTLFVRHRPSEAQAGWAAAAALASEAQASGVAVRTIIAAGDEADLYASLAYDEVIARGSP